MSEGIDLRPRRRIEARDLDAIEAPALRDIASSLLVERQRLESLRETARRWPGVRATIDSAVSAIDHALAEARHEDLFSGLVEALDQAHGDEELAEVIDFGAWNR